MKRKTTIMQPSKDDQSRNVNVPSRHYASSARTPDREAAAQLMRQQIDSIYNDTPSDKQHLNPYKQTHNEHQDHAAANPSGSGDWKQYHSAWQSYYQQYYERYYLAQLHRRQQVVKPAGDLVTAESNPNLSNTTGEVTESEAVHELRSKIVGEVISRSEKVKKSRHFMPIMAALSVALLFSILQYNRLLVGQVKAYVSPGSISPQNVILDPTTNTKVGPEAKVIIPKINVEAPVVYDVPSLEENVIQSKLKNGVVHYPIPGANSVPGQTGNTVILGHSSNDVFDDGAYKFVFVQLDKLEKGDTFYLNYASTRYTYSVTEKKVIDPTEVSQLIISTDKPIATLVTCTPPGTALKRLVVIAEQISPDPTKATQGPAAQANIKPGNIAGNSPTFFQRLFGTD